MENKYFKNIEIEDNHFWLDAGKHSICIKKNEGETIVNVFKKPKKNYFLDEPIAEIWVSNN